jgi:hypothetical protein
MLVPHFAGRDGPAERNASMKSAPVLARHYGELTP